MDFAVPDDEREPPLTAPASPHRRRSPSGCGRGRSTSSSARRSSSRPGKPLREAIERDLLQSIILWGPPGTGKTTLARIIADTTKARFVPFSAVLAGIKEIRDVMAEAERLRRAHRPPHHRLHRRDPPLQQGAAGRVPAARRGGRHRAHRRDDREPVVRGERGAAVALEGVRPARPRRRRGRRRSCARALADTERGLGGAARRDRRRRAAGDRAVRQRRRALGAQPARAQRRRRADRRRPRAQRRPRRASSRRSSGARCSTTRPARSTTT